MGCHLAALLKSGRKCMPSASDVDFVNDVHCVNDVSFGNDVCLRQMMCGFDTINNFDHREQHRFCFSEQHHFYLW